MTLTKILEEDRKKNGVTTLEVSSNIDDLGQKYKVKVVRIRTYASEKTARRAYERLKSQRSMDIEREPSESSTGHSKQGKAKTQTKRKTGRGAEQKNAESIKKRKAAD